MFRSWWGKKNTDQSQNTDGEISKAREESFESKVTVVCGAVFDDELHGLPELLPRRVHPLPHVLPQRLQVHGPIDYLVVILDDLGVDRCVEGVRLDLERGMVLMSLGREKPKLEHVSEILRWGDPAYR